MSSYRIIESSVMNFEFDMYKHDFYHSLNILFTFDINYTDFNEIIGNDYDSFKHDLITNISSSAFIHPSAIHVITSEQSINTNTGGVIFYTDLYDNVIEIRILVKQNTFTFEVDSFLFSIENIHYDSIAISDKRYYNNEIKVFIKGYSQTLNEINTVIQNNIFDDTIYIEQVECFQSNKAVLNIVLNHTNQEDLAFYKDKVDNDLNSIFSETFVTNYFNLLFTETNIVTHQQNSNTGINFDIILHFDWIQLFDDVYKQVGSSYQRNEEYRKGVFKNAYNDCGAVNESISEYSDNLHSNYYNIEMFQKSAVEQWHNYLDIILHETIFNLNPFVSNTFGISEKRLKKDLEFQEKVDIHNPKKMITPVTNSTRYATKYLGNLINNHNVGEIIEKLRENGYFNNHLMKFNPTLDEIDINKFPLYSPLKDDDEIVFPINIRKIYGYTDEVSILSNNLFNPNVSLYTIHIRCIQKKHQNI